MTRYNLLIVTAAVLIGVIAAGLIFAQWGNSNNDLKRTVVMYFMIVMVSLSTLLLSCLLLLGE